MRLFLPFLLITPLLAGCTQSQSKVDISDGKEQLDYSDFADIKIDWKNLFLPAKSQYFVYIYSKSCGHCNNIKPVVLDYIYNEKDWFYMIEFSSVIPLISNTKNTIGKQDIKDLGILGTPTMLGITNKYLSLNIAGEKDILEFLEHLPHNF